MTTTIKTEKFSREEVIELMGINEKHFLKYLGDPSDLDSVLSHQYRECLICEQWVDLDDFNADRGICAQCEQDHQKKA